MNQPPNHVRFIIGCITTLALVATLCGGWLLWKGFAGGGELVMVVNTAIAGMIGFLSNRQPSPTTTTTSTATDSGAVVTTEVTPDPKPKPKNK